MSAHNELGKKGEEIARKFLIEKGYKIIATNWRYKKEEIDIIAKHENEIIFVEVKTRSSSYFEAPEQAVTKKKQKFLINAANDYIQSNNIEIEGRFDIISVICNTNKEEINHIEDAFYPTV